LARVVDILGYKEYFSHLGYVRGSPRFFNYREVKTALGIDLRSQPPALSSQRDEASRFPEGSTDQIGIGSLTQFYVESAKVEQWLKLLPDYRYILGHIPWTPVLPPILKSLNYKQIFIIRDPRAVVTSLLSFILDTKGMPEPHFLEEDFRAMTLEQRLSFLLDGGFAAKAGVEIKGFTETYRAMLAWQNDPNCLFVRFEDLIGSRGGGNDQKQEIVIQKITKHLDIPLNRKNAMQEVYNPSSRTFRMGKIDSWKQSFDGLDLQRLTDYCQLICREAGY